MDGFGRPTASLPRGHRGDPVQVVENIMKKASIICFALSLAIAFMTPPAAGQELQVLSLETHIALPNVKGRIDHASVDVKGERLFVAAVDNHTLEVVDLKSGRRVHTITDLAEPQGVFYDASTNRLFVACGLDGVTKIFDATTFEILATVKFPDDADNIRYDTRGKGVIVGYAGAKQLRKREEGTGGLGFLDSNGKKTGDIVIDAHPESFQLEEAGTRLFDDLTAAMVEEYGGVVRFARLIVQSGIDAFPAAEKRLDELPLTRSWGKTTVTLEPVGVAGLIIAWNANALFICLKLASAVGAGCTVVLKPSELSSLQTQVMLECLDAAQIPHGVCNVVIGRGSVVGAELVRNPDVAKISFTGSVAVGQSIMRDGAATMKRVTLELGGKSPTVLLDDADLDKAIPTALAIAFMNSGQACAAGTRLLVPKSRLDAVKRAIVDAMP